MDVTPEAMRWVLTGMIVLIAAIALHEFGHAWMANRLGDDTPRRQGRLTLNPMAHADPIGTLLLPFVGMMLVAGAGVTGPAANALGFGWGKPVEWQPSRIRRGISMNTATVLVAIAGPSMNILLGTFIAGVHVTLIATGVLPYGHAAHQALGYAVLLNYSLFFFNLIPAPPLDGGWVLRGLAPYKWRGAIERYAVYGPFVVMAFVMITPLKKVITVPTMFVGEHVYRAFGALAGL